MSAVGPGSRPHRKPTSKQLQLRPLQSGERPESGQSNQNEPDLEVGICLDNRCLGIYSDPNLTSLLAAMNDPAAPQAASPPSSIGPLLGRVKMAIGAEVDDALLANEELAPFEVSSAQFSILAQLHFGNTECAGDLCKNMSYDRGAMSRMLDRLESKGLIRRIRRPGERRTISLEITDRGEELFPKMRACIDEVVQRFLLGISPAEIRQVEGVLQRILNNAKG